MRLAILGSTGFVGKVLLEKATARGHRVKALARSPEKLGELAGKVEVVRGDIHDAASLRELVRDVDAVISVAGPPLKGRHDSAHHASATRVLVEAMRATGVRRLITVAGAAARVPGGTLGFKQTLLRAVLSTLKPDLIRTKDLELEIVAASGLDWTVIRPPIIGNGKPAGKVRALEGELAGMKVDVQDLTDFMLALLETREWNGKAPVVASAA